MKEALGAGVDLVTAAQAALFFAEESAEVNGAFNLTLRVDVHGGLSDRRLSAACRHLYDTTSALRIRIALELSTGNLTYRFSPDFPGVQTHRVDGTGAEFQRILNALIRAPFEVDEGALARFAVIRTGPRTASVIVIAHHLLLDGASHVELAERLARYLGGARGVDDAAEYRALTRQVRAGEDRSRAADRDYWRERMAVGLSPAVPSAYLDQQARGGRVTLTFDSATMAKLRATGESRGGSSGFKAVLSGIHRCLPGAVDGATTIVCAATSQRRRSGERPVIGMFVNELPMLARHRSGDGAADILSRESARWQQDLRRRAFPFIDLVGLIQQRVGAQVPVTSVMFAYRACPRRLLSGFDGITCSVQLDYSYPVSMAELSIRFFDHGDEGSCQVHWGAQLSDDAGKAFSARLAEELSAWSRSGGRAAPEKVAI